MRETFLTNGQFEDREAGEGNLTKCQFHDREADEKIKLRQFYKVKS